MAMDPENTPDSEDIKGQADEDIVGVADDEDDDFDDDDDLADDEEDEVEEA